MDSRDFKIFMVAHRLKEEEIRYFMPVGLPNPGSELGSHRP